jgi:RpiB/LacA/LacB family sugar-phosphate isomerase
VKVGVASDHAGFALKESMKAEIAALGHEVVDLGTHSTESVDYPDFAEALGLAVVRGEVARGVLFCGSGIGASVAANKIPGVRAGNCSDTYSAHQGVEHDAMNVLVLGGRTVGAAVAAEMVRAYLAAEYTHEARHEKRLAKVLAIEARFAGGAAAR